MHPAYSVILFTTASGAGYGLLVIMGYVAVARLMPPDRWLGISGFAISFVMITVGLLASTFHLGHPERAWRAFSQYRSSWLSREGIMAVATYLPATIFAFGWVVMGSQDGLFRFAAVATGVLAFLTIYCTAMIYATLRTVRAWCNPYTKFAYLFFAGWTGILWFNFLAHAFGRHNPGIMIFLSVAGSAVWLVKRKYWMLLDSSPPWVPIENATGLGALGKVRLLDAPSTQETYVQKEMGFRVARKHATTLRVYAFFAYFLIPMGLTLATMQSSRWVATTGAFLAVVVGMVGTALERWLFFAEAKHTAALYFGAEDS